jgi:anti-sigma B factor antagonist
MAIQPPRMEGRFSITSRRLEHGIALDLSGDVDLATAPIVEEELRRAAESEDRVVLNLQDVGFMDSTGIRVVISADQRLREQGASLRLVHVPAQVHRLFELVGVIDHLEIDDSLDGGPEPPTRA